MNLKRIPMEFHNVIVRDITEKNFSLQELAEVNVTLLYKGIFATGPIVIEGKWGAGYQKLMIPVNAQVEFKEYTEFSFMDRLRIDDGIYYRSGEEDFMETPARDIMEEIASDLQVELADNYYCIILNVYGGKLFDIYVPLRNEGRND